MRSIRTPRRTRYLYIGVIALIFLILYMSSNNPFYRSTVKAMEAREAEAAAAAEGRARAQMHEKTDHLATGDQDAPALRDNADKAGSAAVGTFEAEDIKAAGEEEVEEISIAGRKKMPVTKPKQYADVGEKTGKGSSEDPKKESSEDEEDAEAVTELNSILKKSPIIIFSKSYCPYSAKAKKILLEKYSIEPAPYVVELDKHTIGPQLQALLGKNTGRRTVPNILVNGLSIGGGDDIAALDHNEELASKIKSAGGKRVMQVVLRSDGTEDGAA